MKTRLGPIVLGFLLLARVSDAQTTAPNLADVVQIRDQVLVTQRDGSQVSGRVLTLTAASLTVDTRSGPQTLPADRIGRIVVKDPIRNGLLIGLGVGAGVGAAGGFLVNAICINETGGCPGLVLALTGIGAGIGAGLGAGFDGLRHKTAWDIMPGTPHEYSPEIFGTVGIGRSQTRTGALTGPASAGAAFAMRHTSGFGFVVDVTRTAGRSTHSVTCANCPADGQEGVVDTTIGSARAQYYFSRSRVQPYVSGGAAIFQDSITTVFTSRPLSSDPPIEYQALQRLRGLAAVFGGGVRIGLNRRVFLQPDVTIYKGAQWTHVRPSVGVGVGW